MAIVRLVLFHRVWFHRAWNKSVVLNISMFLCFFDLVGELK